MEQLAQARSQTVFAQNRGMDRALNIKLVGECHTKLLSLDPMTTQLSYYWEAILEEMNYGII